MLCCAREEPYRSPQAFPRLSCGKRTRGGEVLVNTHTSAHKSRNLTVLHDITCTSHVETKEGGSQVGHGAGFCAMMLSPLSPRQRRLRASAARCGEEIWGSDGRPSRRGWPGGTNRAHSSAGGKLDSSFQCSLLLHSSASRPSMPRSGGRRRRPSASLIG